MDKEMLKLFLNMHGLPSDVVAALFSAGYDDIQKIMRASFNELFKIPGISEDVVANIIKAFLSMDTRFDDGESEICMCDNCGAFVSSNARLCPMCSSPLSDLCDSEVSRVVEEEVLQEHPRIPQQCSGQAQDKGRDRGSSRDRLR